MKINAIRRTLMGLTALLILLPCLALGVGDDIPTAQGAPLGTLRVQLSRLNIADRLDVTLDGAYSATLEGSQLMFGRASDLTILLREGRLYLYYADMRVDAGTDFRLTRHPDTAALENGLRFANNPSLYEGDLRLTAVDGKIRLILTIGVDDYLKGVVPFEMSDSFPLEALKAQAVAARTYAVNKAQANADNSYDLVDTTNDQVYKGRRAEYTQATLAVEQTAGICGFYQGKLAMCYYSASNGGQTELAEHVWNPQEDSGYLDMRDDPFDLENPQSKVQSVVLPKKAKTVADTPYALRLLLSTQLAEKLTAGGYDPAPESFQVDSVTAVSVDTPRFASPSRLYSQLHITFTYSARTRADPPMPEGSSLRVLADADDAEVSLFTAAPLPKPAAPAPAATPTLTPAPTPSPTPAPSYGPFEKAAGEVTLAIPIFPDAEKLLSLGINSYDNEMITVTEQQDSYTIQSRRFGHGVGLSQRGAEWMAFTYQKTYTEILSFYYPGMTLMRFAQAETPLPTVAQPLTQTAGPVPSPTPRPTLMPVTQPLPQGAWYADVTEIDDDSTLNLRASPDASAEILMRLYKNQRVIVLEECPQEDWVRVRTDAVEGYVMEKFLTQQR